MHGVDGSSIDGPPMGICGAGRVMNDNRIRLAREEVADAFGVPDQPDPHQDKQGQAQPA